MSDEQVSAEDAPSVVNFETFILSMGANALVHLGEDPHPETGDHERDLGLARQTIDLLSVLADKTRGNLTDQEARVLQATLYDLRVRFFECCGGADGALASDEAGEAGEA